MNNSYIALEFSTIIDAVKDYALTEQAKNALGSLAPYLQEDICIYKMAETTSARNILDSLGSPPLPTMKDIDTIIILAETGSMLIPEQLSSIAVFSSSCKRMKAYLTRGEKINEPVAVYGRSIEDLAHLQQAIEQCIVHDSVHDTASTALRNIRRKKEHVEGQIKEKLAHVLQSRKQFLADNYSTIRQGHYVVPVLRKYQSQFGGTVIEGSAKGTTVFMEPSSITKIQAELSVLSMDEDSEVRRILYTLTATVADHAVLLRRNMEAIEALDVLFAKAKLSAAMNAGPVSIGSERRLEIQQGRHPLLDADTCVPLDFLLDENTNGVIVTGPNTGGKTVALKTVGLLSLMAQSGLHIPCGKNSYIAMQDAYWCDIGDSQNITQNLSTFSGHMSNVIHILENASPDSFVLLDELGSGTDPAEGMGLAVAVLEELRLRKCMFLVTTHYAQVKTYAEQTTGIQSARMAFDKESLRPLFRLEMGKTGESCALHIAKHLGLAPHLLRRAQMEVYGSPNEKGKEKECSMPVPKSCLVRATPTKESVDIAAKFCMGDSVLVLPKKEIGIVYQPADKNGDVVVQVQGYKRTVKHNRLVLQVTAAELYPPNYDFSIVFDTAENRKARKQMGKRHRPDLKITYD